LPSCRRANITSTGRPYSACLLPVFAHPFRLAYNPKNSERQQVHSPCRLLPMLCNCASTFSTGTLSGTANLSRFPVIAGPIGGFFADRQPRSAHFFPRGYDKTQIHRDCRSVAFFRFRNKPSAEIHHHCMRFRIHRNRSLAPFLYALLYESVSRTSPADLVGLVALVRLVDPQRLPVPASQPLPEDPYLPLRLVGLRVLDHP
jgi:hypothetical protein